MAKMYQIQASLRPRITVSGDRELFASSVGMYASGLRATIGLYNGELQLMESLHLSVPKEREALAVRIADAIGTAELNTAVVEKHLLQLCDVLDGVLLQLEEESKQAGAKPEDDNTGLFLQDLEPWDGPVDGADLIATLQAVIERFVFLPPGAAYTVALWILHTYALDAAFASPILYIRSPQKRCGKSTLMTLLVALCSRALPASNISAASVYRAVEKWQPTLLIDEADTFLKYNEELAGIINAGHTRSGAFVVRVNKDTHEPERFSTWAPKAIAGIGRQRDTIEDRSIQIEMKRKTKEEPVERLRLDQADRFDELKRMCVRWSQDYLNDVRAADPPLRDYLNDREQDNWRTLCAIAEVAGADSLKQALGSIDALYGETGQTSEDESPAILLLTDLRTAFESSKHGRVTSDSLVTSLREMEDRPWPEWGPQQKPITKMQIASLLKPFGIRPTTVNVNKERAKGYKIEDCQDAFYRYLPPVQSETDKPDENLKSSQHLPISPVTPLPSLENKELGENQPVTNDHRVTGKKSYKPLKNNDSNGVTAQNGDTGVKQTVEPENEVSDAPWEDDFDEEF